ncbi:uncharacterized protein [Periplaneta americana]|uniref:uncharacterized protein n=1 Tax=Periplaneta americana TaxID=6978 RepID=UPI0037E8F06B
MRILDETVNAARYCDILNEIVVPVMQSAEHEQDDHACVGPPKLSRPASMNMPSMVVGDPAAKPSPSEGWPTPQTVGQTEGVAYTSDSLRGECGGLLEWNDILPEPPEAADSLDRPPWMAMLDCFCNGTRGGPTRGGVSPRTDRGALGEIVEAGMIGAAYIQWLLERRLDNMRRSLLLSLLVLAFSAVAVTSSILDMFTWDGLLETPDESQQRDNEPNELVERSCSCEGPACNCCLDINITFIDLGGPGCVRMKYLSPTDGIAVNVSYGSKLLHREVVKGANPEPTCIDILSDLAQLCARFSDLAPTSDGLRWCLQLEPTLLGDVQAQYLVGCFRMGPDGMSVDPPITNTTSEASTTDSPTNSTTGETVEEINEEELIAAVNESAEHGIALISNFLGLAFGGGEAPSNATEIYNTTDTTQTSPEEQTPVP